MGLPVIGARTDGIPEQVTPESGMLVEPDNAGDLASAIERIAGLDAAARAGMGRAGRERVQAAFSLDQQAAGLERAYRSAIAARKARS
jgi:glycosyltransferase involved in cell wall biosynthesis